MSIPRKDKNSAWEMRQIQALNADLNRTDYSKISKAPSSRAHLLASLNGRNRFELCRAISCLAKTIQNPRQTLMQATITSAMRMLTNSPAKKRMVAVTVEVVAA